MVFKSLIYFETQSGESLRQFPSSEIHEIFLLFSSLLNCNVLKCLLLSTKSSHVCFDYKVDSTSLHLKFLITSFVFGSFVQDFLENLIILTSFATLDILLNVFSINSSAEVLWLNVRLKNRFHSILNSTLQITIRVVFHDFNIDFGILIIGSF